MSQQLIVNILGTASLESLSIISACISENECNILDSRHALYGTDFSLTMIVSGSASAMTHLELALSTMCVQHDLLCMMKRTSGHIKQNLDQLIQLSFSGQDKPGLIQKVSAAVAKCGLSVSALRQQAWQNSPSENAISTSPTLGAQFAPSTPSVPTLKCKMILSAPKETDLSAFDNDIKRLLHDLGLHGQIVHNIQKETHEHIESW